MGCLLLLIVLVLIFGVGTFLAIGLIGLAITLVITGLVGWAADLLVPGGALPWGWVGAVLTGFIGGLLGTWLFSQFGIHDPGFDLAGVHLIPAFVGAVIIALAAKLYTSRRPVA